MTTGRLLQAVLRAVERQPGRRRRHRHGDAAALVEKWFSDVKTAPASDPMTIPGVALTDVQRKTITDRVQLPRITSRGSRRGISRRATRRSTSSPTCSPAARTRASTSASSTTCRWRRTCQRLPGIAGALLGLPDRGDAAARAYVDELLKVIDEEIAKLQRELPTTAR